MQKTIAKLAKKKFSSYFMGEFEGRTTFYQVMRQISINSDIFSMDTGEITRTINRAMRTDWLHIDCQVSIKIY